MTEPAPLVLTRLVVGRYKPFADRVDVPVAPITLVLGHNNAGKSALMKAVVLLSDSMHRDAPGLRLWGGELAHGEELTDLVHGRHVHGAIELGLWGSAGDRSVAIETTVRGVSTKRGVQSQVVDVLDFTLADSLLRLRPVDPFATPVVYRATVGRAAVGRAAVGRAAVGRATVGSDTSEPGEHVEVRLAGLRPLPRLPGGVLSADLAGALLDTSTLCQALASHVVTLGPHRDGALGDRKASPTLAPRVERDGRGTVEWLSVSASLLDSVNRWARDALDVELRIRHRGDSIVRALVRQRDGNEVALEQAGQGVAEVLPVAVQCLSKPPGEGQLLVIEQPELHLHPAAHPDLADLLVAAVASRRRRVLVETHSENLVLRLRRRIAEGKLAPDDVVIWWVESGADGAAVRQVRITSDGELENWPRGVFYEDFDEFVALRRAQACSDSGEGP